MNKTINFDPYSPDTLPENFRPSELALVYTDHGRRTEFVLKKMLKTLCFDRKIPVLLFCDDFEKELLLEDLVPIVSSIPRTIVQCLESENTARYITAEANEKVLAAKNMIQNAPLNIEEVERLPVREVCERAKKIVSGKQLEIIFVYADLAYLEDTVGSSCDCNLNEINDKIEIVSKGMMSYRLNTLKTLARELNLPVVMVTNFTRNPDGISNAELVAEIGSIPDIILYGGASKNSR